MKALGNWTALAACLSFLQASEVAAADVTYHFDDSNVVSLSGFVSATVVANGIPLEVSTGPLNYPPGTEDTVLTPVGPGSIPGLPHIVGLGVSQSGTPFNLRGTLQFTMHPTFALTSVTIRTLGATTGLSVHTFPEPGSVSSVIQNSTEVLNSYYTGISSVETLMFRPGVTRFAIVPIFGKRPALLVLSITGTAVPEPSPFVLVLTALIFSVACRR